MKLSRHQTAPDFTATTIDGNSFRLSSMKGKKILLSLFRNGACAICNLRVHELIQRYPAYSAAGLQLVAVFESAAADMLPYVGRQQAPFPLLADPEAKIYSLYGAENSPEKIQQVLTTGILESRIRQASEAGYELTPQEGANFFRIPADFLIDESFTIREAFYEGETVLEHMPFASIDAFLAE